MADRFEIQRGMDRATHLVGQRLKERQEMRREALRARERRLVKLSVGYYFDPKEKAILRKVGAGFVFVRHDRRLGGRKTQAQAEARQFRLISGGLFWDESSKKLYRKSGHYYALYTSDRRKISSKHSFKERRAKAGPA